MPDRTKKRLVVTIQVSPYNRHRCGKGCPFLGFNKGFWGPQTARCIALGEELGVVNVTGPPSWDSGVLRAARCLEEARDPA